LQCTLASFPLPNALSHAAVKLLYLRFFFASSVLVSGWESLRRSLLEAGASRRLMEDIRLAAAALRQNILAVGGPDTPLLDTLDQQDLTTKLHKFRVSQTAFRYFFIFSRKLHFYGARRLDTVESTFTLFFKDKKPKEVKENSINQGFSYYFCLMIEGSGSGCIPLTNGSGSRRPKTCGSGNTAL
jgi:hypothetical protein